ncbi:MAG: hypothetical protein ACRDQ7_18795 [Haloechinothrix sp.]
MTAPTRSRTHSGRSHAGRGARTGSRSRTTQQRAGQRSATQRQSTRSRPVRSATTERAAPEGGRRSAAEKAYARRAHRTETVLRGAGDRTATAQEFGRLLKIRLPTTRAGFVVLMMGLLTAGVALTLWLSTQAIADSYRLDSVRGETAALAERAERLQQEVTRRQSASSLAGRARALGMVPSEDPARILVSANGKPKLFGEPKKAQPRPASAPPRQPERQETARSSREGEAERGERREEDRQGADRRQVRADGAPAGDEAAGGR